MTTDILIGEADVGSCVSFDRTHLQLVCVMQKLVDQSECDTNRKIFPSVKHQSSQHQNQHQHHCSNRVQCILPGAGGLLEVEINIMHSALILSY